MIRLSLLIACGCSVIGEFAWAAMVGADDLAKPEPQLASDEGATESGDKDDTEEKFTTQSLRGRVVWLSEALERLHDVRTTEDAQKRVLALVTESGEIYPLIEDRRGRAFRKDERLRNREVELFVRRYPGVPLAQVIQVYAIKSDGKYILDYWCDICAISMVEDGPCDCCQAPNVLRERKAD